MKRLVLFALALAFGWAQESDVNLSPPTYIFVALNVSTVTFDFTQEAATAPGALAALAADAYPDDYPGGFPAANEPNWKACLGVDEEVSGSYQGSPAPPTVTPKPCRFSPSAVTKQAFEVDYYGIGRAPCDRDLQSDADLLIVTNKNRWRVTAQLDKKPPAGIELHILPLTLRPPRVLCRYTNKYTDLQKPKRWHDYTLKTTQAVKISVNPDPSDNRKRTRRSYFTQYQVIYTVPMLYYLQIDLSSLDPMVFEQTTEIQVTYIVRNRR